MPKRTHENSMQHLANQLRKLKKKLKRSRRQRSLSETSSSSSSSSGSENSRSNPPAPPVLLALSNEDRNEHQSAPTRSEPAVAATASEPIPGILTSDVDGDRPDELQNQDFLQADMAVEHPVVLTDTGLDAEILEILGSDPSTTVEYGPDINNELASRLTHVATSGLDKDTRKELLQKYLVPGNCKNLSAPQLNPEIKAATPEHVQKRDKAIEINQKQIAAAVTCISQIITSQIDKQARDNELLKNLMDASRILCDVQHIQSSSRRNYALASLKKDLREQLSNTKVDGLLFGQDLCETIKTAKAVSRSCSDLKADATRKTKHFRNLNSKSGPGSRRVAPGPQRYQPPAAPRATTSYQPPPPPQPPPQQTSSRAHSSSTSYYRPRQTRRR